MILSIVSSLTVPGIEEGGDDRVRPFVETDVEKKANERVSVSQRAMRERAREREEARGERIKG